ncbi:ATP-binding protein [Falsihalocynthiibacter sp. S25ZX9]|uniref:hybrid sensor histidine kinase/response regulator n=1 Tax=Falsihalocynthiibacter sp. S25ZX9 TaxID=3240870 RepID=UPI003510987A
MRMVPILIGSGVLVVLGFVVPAPKLGIAFLAAGLTLAFMALLLHANTMRSARRRARSVKAVAKVVRNEPSPSFLTGPDGEIEYQNIAANERFSFCTGRSLASCFGDLFANPSSVVFRLQNKALALGSARDDIVTRRGHVRISVHLSGPDFYVWRLDELADQSGSRGGAEGMSLPMLTASRSGTVLFMNESFRRLVGERVKTLDRIFNSLPVRSGMENEITTREGPMRAVVAELESTGGRREIYILPRNQSNDLVTGDWPFFDDIPVPLMKITSDGLVVAANKKSRDLLASDIPERTPLSDLMEGLGRSIVDWLSEAAQGRGMNNTEFLKARNPDKEVFLQVTLSRVIQDGVPLLVAVLNDATELKTLEAQFVQSQKMQAIGQLAGGVAHDFNNLLTAISGHCDLLLLRHDQGDSDFADLVQINQNANRAASLVGQLLAFSRKQNLSPETIDLSDTLSDLAHLLNRLVGEKVVLSVTHDPDLQTIRADKRQLEQVLMNLVVNARDAMPDGGEIRVETQSRTLRVPLERDRAVVPPGDYVIVRVSDEGVGIPADRLPKIFEPFFTTKRTGEGTGLGLSTAYGIVKQSGGFIFVDSVVGSGTSFTLYFPAFDGPVEQPVAPIIRDQSYVSKTGEGVVLLVEDEAPVRAFASRALRLRGYTVLEAEDAESALKTLEDKELTVDIFVTDVIMPGMDGPSWVKIALKDRPGVKVVFVSGYSEEDFSDNQRQIPNSVFLPKPFSLNDLTSTVQNQLI